MKGLCVFAAAISSAVVCNAAAPPVGTAQAGATKAALCQACHGVTGNSTNPDWPSLAGLGADYLAEQLQNFKDGKRANPVMAPIAAPLSAQDMADLGAYFDTLANTGLEADPSYWQAGEKLYRGGDRARGVPACIACHGPTGHGDGQMGPMVQAPDLTRADWQSKTTDAEMAAVIKGGRNRMPSFNFPDPVVAGLVARIRSLQAR